MDADPSLRRFERDMVVACLGMAAIALVLRGGRPDAALGVLGGGALIGFSYRAIKGAVDAILRRAPGLPAVGDGAAQTAPLETVSVVPRRRDRMALALVLVKFFTRYALLALGAYVMLRFRLHPVGLLAGASSPVLAAGAEAVRLLRVTSGRPR